MDFDEIGFNTIQLKKYKFSSLYENTAKERGMDLNIRGVECIRMLDVLRWPTSYFKIILNYLKN